MAVEAKEPAPAPESKQPTSKKKTDEPGFIESLAELRQFLKDTYTEFRKISWPNRQQVVKETWSVLVLVTALTLAVLAFDFAIARTVFEPLDKMAKKTGGGVGGSQQQVWGPLQPEPGAPVNNPGVPGDALPTPPAPAPGQTKTQPAPTPEQSKTAPAPAPEQTKTGQ